MNQQRYRIVFSKVRGQYMAVAETARAHGKDAGNTSTPGRSTSHAVHRLMLGGLSLNLALNPLLGQLAHAQIVADPGAPGSQRPTVLQAPNGVPVVNIQTPSTAGVSRNTYSQFDVQQQGAILNNSRSNVQSQQGGWVQGNPWLATGTAKIILNEVNSANPSQINGYLEIAGQKAELVIANPAGIHVDGGGFINASRALLTTGVPQFGQGGSLDGYRVQRGTIAINGRGLDASLTDYTGILARAAQINAGVWGNHVAVITGQNTVSGAAGQNGSDDIQSHTAQPVSDASKPQFALDVSQLGGMYAGKITLIGTEAGLGVRNAGAIGASAGQVLLSADGLLTNSGTIAASGTGQDVRIDTQGRGVDNSGTVVSQHDVHWVNAGAVRNSGTVSAARELQVQADSLDNSQGKLTAARLDIDAHSVTNTLGKISQTGAQNLGISAQVLNNSTLNGQAGAIGAIPVTSIGNAESGIGAGAIVDLPSTAGNGGQTTVVTTTPDILAAGRIAVTGQIDNAGGQIIANGQTDLDTSQSLTNSASIQVRQLSAQGGLDNSGGSLNVRTLHSQLDQLGNRGGMLYSVDSLNLQALDIDNTRGRISTAGALFSSGTRQIDNRSGTLVAEADVHLASETLANDQGHISSHSGNVAIQTQQMLSNRGGNIQTVSTATDETLQLSAGTLDNTGGHLIQSGGGIARLGISDTLDNSTGEITSEGALNLLAGSIHNQQGAISSRGSVSIQGRTGGAGMLQNQSGTIVAGSGEAAPADLSLSGLDSISNTAGGSISASGNLILAGNVLNNASGSMGAAGALQITATTLTNDQGQLLGNQGVLLQTGLLSNRDQGQIGSANSSVRIDSGTVTNRGGRIVAQTAAALDSQSLDNSAGQISGDTVAIDTHTQQLTNNAGRIASTGGATTIASGALDNRGGAIQSATTLTLDTRGQNLDNSQSGTLAGVGQVTVTTAELHNTGGLIQAGGTLQATAEAAARTVESDLQIHASGALQNEQGTVQASRDLTVTARSLDNSQGALQAAHTLSATAAQALTNTGGQIIANEAVHLSSDSLSNDVQGQIGSANSSVRIDSGTVTNRGGRIVAQTAAALDSQSLDNSAGQISGDTVAIDTHTQQLTNNAGRIASTGGATTIASGALDNRGGAIQSATTLTLDTRGQNLDNSQSGTLAGVGQVTVTTAELHNTGGLIQAGGTLQATAEAAARTVESDLQIHASGALQNEQGTVQASRDLTVTARSLDNSQGALQAAHTLSATAAQALTNTGGQIIANEAVHLSSDSLSNDVQGQIGSANSSVRIDSGTVTNRGGRIVAQTAAALDSQSLDNSAGQISGDTVAIDTHTQQLTNNAGRIASTGGATTIASGALDNRGGAIQSATTLTLDTRGQNLDNSQSGTLAGVGQVTITTAELHNTGGLIQAGGDLGVQSTELDNRSGALVAGQTLFFSSTGAALNQGGLIASRQDLSLQSASLDNDVQGQIGSQGGNAMLHAGVLSNRTGTIASAANTSVISQSLDNTGGLISGQNVAIDTQGQSFGNDSGVISATAGSLAVRAGSASNQAGVLYAAGPLQWTSGALNNHAGQIGSLGNVSLHMAGDFDNQGGLVQAGQGGAATLQITSAGSMDNTAGGHVVSTGDVSVTARGALDNQDGTVSSQADAQVIAAGVYNNGGRIAADTLSVQSQDTAGNAQVLTNQGGVIAANRSLNIESASLDNSHAGTLLTAQAGSTLNVHSHGQDIVNSQSGSTGGILAAGSLQLQTQGGILDNANGGYVGAASAMDIQAVRIDNHGGVLAANGNMALITTATSGVALDNSAQGLIQAQGSDIGIRAGSADISNRGGTILADGNLEVRTTGTVDNQGGQMQAGQTLRISNSQNLGNSGGTLHAGQLLALDNTTVNGGGALLSDRDVRISQTAGYTLAAGGQLSANGSLTLSSQGDVVNQGVIQGGSAVSVSGANIDNQTGASITSGGSTTVSTGGSLTNRGLIDGSDTRIDAGSLNNTGTGRIYGDYLSVRSGTLTNQAETTQGITSSATMAARQQLDLGVQTLNNLGGSSLLSLGDLHLAGGLDASRQATQGQADRVQNSSSLIEAKGNMTLNAQDIVNSNSHLTVTPQVLISSTAQPSLYQVPGAQPELASDFVERGGSIGLVKKVHPDKYGTYIPRAQYSVGDCLANTSTLSWGCTSFAQTNYTEPRNSPRYAEYGITPPPQEEVAKPNLAAYGGWEITVSNCGASGDCNLETQIVWKTGADQKGYYAALAPYNADQQAYQTAVSALDAAIVAANTENNRTTGQWRQYTYLTNITQTVYQDQLAASDPGRITAGGHIVIQGNLDNRDSQVTAGGAIDILGGSLTQSTTQGKQTTIIAGSADSIYWKYHGGFSDYQEKNESWSNYYQPSTTTFNLPTTVFLPNAATDLSSTVAANGNSGQNVQGGTTSANGLTRTTQTPLVGSATLNGADAATSIHADMQTPTHTAVTASAVSQAAVISPLQNDISGVTGGAGQTPTASGPSGLGSHTVSATHNTGSASVDAAAARTDTALRAASAIQVTLASSSADGATIARTLPAEARIPQSSLYHVNPEAGRSYLIETDPAFASYRQWLSSDYMLQALGLDPALTQKRLGDGYHEQQSIEQQVAQLTGRRFAGDYRSDDEQYQGLMDAGVSFAQSHQLRPGVALTPAQMAQLTSDIVWLVSQTVTLADGSQTTVLVPQVYVVTRSDDLSGSGALISGSDMRLHLTGDLSNHAGTMAARQVVDLGADNIHNVGGRITGQNVALTASRDLTIEGGTVDASQNLLVSAGRDLAITSTTATEQDPANTYLHTGIDRVAGLYLSGTSGSGTLLALAGRDLTLTAGVLDNTHSAATASTTVQAGRDLTLGTLTTAEQQNIRFDAQRHLNWGITQDIGSRLDSQGALTLSAGRDLSARAASIQTQGTLHAAAAGNLALTAGQGSTNVDDAYYYSSHGLLGSSSDSIKDSVRTTRAIGSDIGGQTIRIDAGQNLQVQGSSVIADKGTELNAGADMTITAAQNTTQESHSRESHDSGFLASGTSVSIGQQSLRSTQTGTATTASGSTIGTISGNTSIRAGNQYLQSASLVSSPQGNVTIAARNLDITAGQDTYRSESAFSYESSGLSIALASPVISATQQAMGALDRFGQSKNSRVNAMAAANAGWQGYQAASAMQGLASGASAAQGLNISITYGQQKSTQHSQGSGTQALASGVQAGGSTTLLAQEGPDSTISVTGSDIAGKQGTALYADKGITLQAAQQDSQQNSSNS
ncbi:filamentous hemagglutinin N-terminal domain-containing protein, partial [Brachymonas sp. M4Q-1]|uniref:two-partner secretion domain-containing protein n=1 Tax=Brachymonas sp. M4Q-1 TaxID=3416906 RepID=UPI003CF02E47